MGSQTIPVRSGKTDASWFNLLKSVVAGDLVPRNASGVATAQAAALGTSSFRWLKAFIEVGHWSTGDVKLHHTYNGNNSPGQGWMKCDGRQITQANYDAEHGSGSWATYVGSTVLENRYLPGLVGRYAVGASATTATGSSAIPTVGNANHQVDLRHTHQWTKQNVGTPDQSYNSSGSLTSITQGSAKASGAVSITVQTDQYNSNYYVEKQPGAVSDLQPDSIQFVPYMRIV